MRPHVIGGYASTDAAAFGRAIVTRSAAVFDARPLDWSIATTFRTALPGFSFFPKLSRFELAPGWPRKSISLSVFEPRLRIARTLAGLSSVRCSVVRVVKAVGFALTFVRTGAAGAGAPGSGC